MNPTAKRLSATLTSHSLLHETQNHPFPKSSNLTPERVARHLNLADDQAGIDRRYKDVEKSLKSAKDIASNLAVKLHMDKAETTLQYDDRNYQSSHIIHVDKRGLKEITAATYTEYDIQQSEMEMRRNQSSGLPDYKLIISQRDSEIHALRQNFEIQYQESIILKQKLQQSVMAYEQLSSSMREKLSQDNDIQQLLAALERSEHVVRETRQENATLREKLLYLEREGAAASQRILQTERNDFLDKLSAKDKEIAQTLLKMSSLQKNHQFVSDMNSSLEADKRLQQIKIEGLERDVSGCANERDSLRKEIKDICRQLDDGVARYPTFFL